MVLKTHEMRSQLKSLFPSLLDWLPTDREYLPVDNMAELIEKYADPLNRYIPSLWECEEIAMAFIVDVRRGRLDNLHMIEPHFRKNLAIGEALGTRWDGEKKSHHANIFFSMDGVYLCDLQTKKIWKAKNGNDDIFFVRM